MKLKDNISNIAVVGAGYVGTSIAVMLSQSLSVKLIDIDEEKIKKLNSKISPIEDKYIQEYLDNKILDLSASNNLFQNINNFQLIIICLPTNFVESKKSFDTTLIEQVLQKIYEFGFKGACLIKSTVPIGFTQKMNKANNTNNIYFSPEFLREGQALKDNLYPSRIIIGGEDNGTQMLGSLLRRFSLNNPSILYMSSNEAESVKLFSNTYLATRIAFFNELDTFCMQNNLDSKNVIDGICLDPRIGNEYNNPSFGYGGYCLPKDTKQLHSQLDFDHNQLVEASIKSNESRIKIISETILNMELNHIGIYRITMKQGSDNHRESSMIKIIDRLRSRNIEIRIFEPSISSNEIFGLPIEHDLNSFISFSQIIIANRLDDSLKHVSKKVFTRDIFNIN